MPRNVTVTLSSGETLQFADVPDDVTPDQIQARAESESGGATVVSIDGGRPSAQPAGAAPTEGAPADAVPMDGVAPQAPQEDIAGYEGALRGLYQRYAEKKQPFNTADIAALASQYNIGNITNLPEIEEFYNKYGTLNPSLKSVSLDAPAAAMPKQDEMVGAVPQGSNNAQRARAFAKGFAFDFNDELEAAARTFMSGEMSADEYYRLKKQINDDYNAWAQANQAEAFGLELGGGIASSFLPLGAVTKGFQAGSKLANVGTRAVASGALSGAVTGVGQAEGLTDIPTSVLENAALGAVTGGAFGKGAEYTGRGASIAKQKYLEKFGPGLEVWDDVAGRFVRVPETPLTSADRRAAEILTEAAGERGPYRALGTTALANRQGVPLRLGTSNPELTALADKVATKASSGQEGLIKSLIESRAGTADRVSAKTEAALPGAKDYFEEEEAISDRLRSIGDNEYQRAFAVGEVNDPEIMAIINNPSPIIRSIWQSVQNTAQIAEKELRMAMEPVLDAGGNLVGLAPTKNAVPDVETLDLFKRALDDRIQKGFKGTGSEGKFEADALKTLRNNMVSRLDDLVPEYRAARKKYAGDLEVRDAMRYGLDIFKSKMRPAELRMKLKDMSDAEKEAVKTGALEAAFRNLEGASGGDLAKKLAGTPEKLQKLKSIMGPQEAKFFERVMQKESQLYQRTSKIIGGSPTAGRLEGLNALDDMIQNGNLDEAVNFLTAGPVGRAAALGRFVSKFNFRKEFGDQVYTKLSRALSAQKPEELREVLDMLRRSQSYTDYMTSVKNFAGGRAASVAGTALPTLLAERGFEPAPFTEIDPAAEAQAAEEDAAMEADGFAYSSGEEVPVEEETTAPTVPPEGTVTINGRTAQLGEDGVLYYVDDGSSAEGISLGMYRGGSVQAFNKGGNAKKQTSWYDDLTMAVSRRGNDLVATVADLADKYGLTPADATAWVAQNVAGYSPQQAAQIRKNLSGMSNRAMVNAGAASNEARFRNSGGVGARSADMVTPPVRMSDVAYRVQDIPRAVISETPKALRAAGNYITNTAPQTMLRDAQRAGSVAINAIAEDPYGMAFDTALYPAFPVAASAGDFAAIRGGARELSPYVRDDAEAAKAKRMVDALSVLPLGGGMAGRHIAKKR
jgi:hypothetical protein